MSQENVWNVRHVWLACDLRNYNLPNVLVVNNVTINAAQLSIPRQRRITRKELNANYARDHELTNKWGE